MAQWIGQFRGFTHAGRAEEAETTLRNAVAASAAAPSGDGAARIKHLRKLADRVLRARLQLLRAALDAARRIPTTDAIEKQAKQIDRLIAAHDATVAGGAEAILLELGIESRPSQV